MNTRDGDSDINLSGIRVSELEEGHHEPIPLDVIASELRRQSEISTLERGKKPKPEDEVFTQTPPDGTRAVRRPSQPEEDDAPLISRQDLQALMEDQEPSNPVAKEPRKTRDVLTDRLFQVRQRAEQAERQRAETDLQNRELRQQLNSLRNAMENRIESIDEKAQQQDSEEIGALRRELELVRARAASDMEVLRKRLQEAARADEAARSVELEAEIQALRQETAVLRHAVQEKDKVLEDLANQCRGLEDVLEDRDREMDRLNRELEQFKDDKPDVGPEAESEPPEPAPIPRQEPELRFTYKEKDTTEILDGPGMIYVPDRAKAWPQIAIASLIGLLLGLIALEVVFMSTGRGELFTFLMREQAVEATPQLASRTTAGAPDASAVRRAPAERKAPAEVKPPVSVAGQAQTAAGTPKQAARPKLVQDRLKGGGLGPVLVVVSGGSFLMGDKLGVQANNERPAHQVRLAPYAIGRYEVTFEEYDRFARATGRNLPNDGGWGRGKQPVINVTWDDAIAYTEWLSRQTGKTYRLPSEAEWEHAARGGSASRYWWGYESENGRAVCLDCGSRWDAQRTAPVGSLAANPFGLHDTAGNAMEWVSDCYNSSYQGAPADGSAWLSGDCGQRVVRGGAYNKPVSSLRSSARYRLPRDAVFSTLGFRVVRE